MNFSVEMYISIGTLNHPLFRKNW